MGASTGILGATDGNSGVTGGDEGVSGDGDMGAGGVSGCDGVGVGVRGGGTLGGGEGGKTSDTSAERLEGLTANAPATASMISCSLWLAALSASPCKPLPKPLA